LKDFPAIAIPALLNMYNLKIGQHHLTTALRQFYSKRLTYPGGSPVTIAIAPSKTRITPTDCHNSSIETLHISNTA
jgi:hypothetical protein